MVEIFVYVIPVSSAEVLLSVRPSGHTWNFSYTVFAITDNFKRDLAIFKIYYYFLFHVYGCMPECMSASHGCSVHRGRKRASDLL